jgi:phospholipid-binding lipoprotein MlaA
MPATVQRPAPGSPSQDRPVGVASEEIELEAVQLTGAAPAKRLQFSTQTDREELQEYDPWEPYNEKMFAFNHDVFDKYLLKPVANVWDKVVPDWLQQCLANAFDNVGMPRRLVNSLLQAKFRGAGREVTRFFINSVFGIGGFFDIAKDSGLQKSDEDTGQTLGFYGVGPGAYLILPILPPLTVRDGIGYVADAALDPLSYFIPFAASAGRWAGESVNTRSQNLELFQSVEENTVDLYSAVRNAYLQRRQKAIEE